MLKIETKQLSEPNKNKLENFLYHFLGQDTFEDEVDYFLLDETMLNTNVASSLTNWLHSNNISYDIISVASQKETKHILPITGCKDITIYQTHALLMQVPLLNKNMYPWYYCNFINIFYYRLCCYDYTDTESFFERSSYYSRITFQDIHNFNTQQSFIEALSKNNYIFFWTDKYYLKGTNAYQIFHDIHPVLIHGYDIDNSLYYYSYFEPNSSFHSDFISFTSLHKSLESACFYGADLVERPVAYIIKPAYFYGEYNGFIQRFLNELHDYITGNGNKHNVYFTIRRPIDESGVIFGIDITQEVINGFRQKHTSPFDYRLIHLMVENKKLILERLQFANANICNHKLDKDIDIFQQVVEVYETIRMKYIKFSMQENNAHTFYPAPTKDRHVKILCEKLSYALSEEKKLIKILYSKILQCIAEENNFGCINMLKDIKSELTIDSKTLTGNINLEHITSIGYIKVHVFGNSAEGELQVNGSNIISQEIKGTYKNYDFYCQTADVHNISYKLTKFSYDELIQPLYICAYRNNLQSHLHQISCSSVYSGRNDLTFSPKDTLSFDKESFWCPELSDNERFILYELDDIICVNRLTILQHYGAIRLQQFSVLYSVDNLNWDIAIHVNSEIGKNAYIEKFKPIKGKLFKLIIEETKVDFLGYDLPNICFFDLTYSN